MIKPTYIPEGKYFTQAQVSEMLSVIHRTVQKWIEKEWLPALQIPGLGYLIKENDLNDFLSKPRPKSGYPKGRPRKS